MLTELEELRKEYDYWAHEADAKKLGNNGIFGKLFERRSIFFAPKEGVQVTVTGQVALLMLIESLDQWGISVVSANTDGIVIKCHRALHPIRDLLLHDWEALTGYELEQTEYKAIYSRDVNNYIAIAKSGKVKCKGVFAAPVPTASNWPAPSGQICVDAIIAHLTRGGPIEDVILSCNDIRQFIYVRAVKGGGEITDRLVFPKKPSKRFAAEVLSQYGFSSYEEALEWSRSGGKYLGKMVRWYYAKDSERCIKYVGSGNLVPRTQGCQDAMVLPDSLPIDIDYDWYIEETKSLMRDIACTTQN